LVSLQQNIQDTFWQPAATHTYDLSIFVGVHSLLYSITDGQSRLLALRTYQLDAPYSPASAWGEIVAQDAWVQMRFRKVRISYASDYMLSMPESLFLPSQSLLYLERSFANFDAMGHKIAYCNLPNAAVLVYSLPFDWLQTLSEHFEEAEHEHSIANWLKYILARKSAASGSVVYAHVQHRNLYLSVCDGQQLLFFNSFEFLAASDFLYYTLLVYQNLGLSPQTQPLYLSGELLEESEIYTLLHKYVREIQFLDAPDSLQIGAPFGLMAAHVHLDLHLLRYLA
jgi:hypothetical protein